MFQVTNLQPGTNYTFRLLAVNAAGSTAGASATGSTTNDAPGEPDPPLLQNWTANGVDVLFPALPANALSFSLQIGNGMGGWTTIATNQQPDNLGP
jgi:hypothetical protein